MKNQTDDIELRSEEVQDILTRPPGVLVRWGITVFFGVLAVVLIGGCFFKYPDTVSAEVTVTTEHPPVWMVARGSGKIKEVYHADRDSVYPGDLIAVLENPAETGDVLALRRYLQGFRLADSCVLGCRFPEKLALGSIQPAYAAFLRAITDYRNFLSLDLYAQQMSATRRELAEYKDYIFHLQRQVELDGKQSEIAENVHRRESLLFADGLISEAEYEEARQGLLSKQQGTEQLMTSLSSARIQQAQLQQALVETEMERARESNSLGTALKAAYDELLASIEEWTLAYLFTSPVAGILSYNDVWQANQNVNSGDKVFSVVSEQLGDIIGKMKLPADGSGKVQAGQRVNISLSGLPYLEFGFLTGKVQSVSLLPDEEGLYTVTVSLPQDLQTSYGHHIPFGGEMPGQAEVLTDERSLTARLVSPLRYLWEKYR